MVDTSKSDVTLEWEEWLPDIDVGDPALVGYRLFYQRDGADGWSEAVDATSEMGGLEPDTDYRFAVAAIREGTGGTGPLGPSTEATTLCGRECVFFLSFISFVFVVFDVYK